MNKTKTTSVDRRAFVQTSALAGAGILAGALLSGCTSQNSSSQTSWDEEVDVIIVGAGTGVYTALRLKELGLTPLVIEKTNSAGGSTVFSSSAVWAPCNALMKQNGDDDSREEALTYIQAGGGDTYIPEIAEAFVDHVNPAVEAVTRLTGMEWDYWKPGIDYRSDLPGGKKIGRSLVPRVEEGQTIVGVLFSSLHRAAREAGIEIRVNTTLLDLILNTSQNPDSQPSKQVLGILVDQEGTQKKIKARHGVILAAGGFDWNQEMMKNYLRVPAQYSWGAPSGVGEVHQAAMRAGCALRFMNEGWNSPGYKKEYEESFAAKESHLSQTIRDDWKRGLIFVNKHGKRFCNETSNYDSLGRVFAAQECGPEPRGWQNLPAFAICDQTCVDTFGVGGGKPGEQGYFDRYETLDELADACGIDKTTLTETIQYFNEQAALGQDPLFGRGQDYYSQNYLAMPRDYEPNKRALAPVAQAPFYAAEIIPVVLGTMGGIKVNAQAQALDHHDKIIDGLYAQGNNAGTGCGAAFYAGGGGTLGPALAFGEIAATQIAGKTSA